MTTKFTCPDGHTIARENRETSLEEGEQTKLFCPICRRSRNFTVGEPEDTPDDEILVGCPECGTAVMKDREEAPDVAEKHNKKAHDGEEVADVGSGALKTDKLDLTVEQKLRLAKNLRRMTRAR